MFIPASATFVFATFITGQADVTADFSTQDLVASDTEVWFDPVRQRQHHVAAVAVGVAAVRNDKDRVVALVTRVAVVEDGHHLGIRAAQIDQSGNVAHIKANDLQGGTRKSGQRDDRALGSLGRMRLFRAGGRLRADGSCSNGAAGRLGNSVFGRRYG